MPDLRGLFRASALAAAMSLCASPAQDSAAPAPTLSELFVKAKAQFRGGGYEASLATLQKLDEASRAPGLEAAREQLAPALAFYRAANLAALGRKADAKKEFQIYLASTRVLRLDPSMYPKSVLDAFAEARDEMQVAGASSDQTPAKTGDPDLMEGFSKFRAQSSAPAAIDETWADGAVRFLMTRKEKEDWRSASDPASRAELVSLFWHRRDPTPETPENEYRIEIERRLAFADAHFAQGEKKGSQTDRGMVFVVMGPPSSVGRQLLKTEDDPIQVARSAPQQELVRDVNGRVTMQSVSREAMSAEKIQGTREIWHYRRDRLPPSVRSNRVDFEFLTKEGYGVAVLQREADALTAIDVAARPPGDPDR